MASNFPSLPRLNSKPPSDALTALNSLHLVHNYASFSLIVHSHLGTRKYSRSPQNISTLISLPVTLSGPGGHEMDRMNTCALAFLIMLSPGLIADEDELLADSEIGLRGEGRQRATLSRQSSSKTQSLSFATPHPSTRQPRRRPIMSPRPHSYGPHPMRLRQRIPNTQHTRVLAANILGIARIGSVQDAQDWLCLAQRERDTAAKIDVVEVIGHGGKLSAFKIVHRLLKFYATKITVLRLRLAFDPNGHMLQSLEFANLRIFETNVSHALIAPFLARHSDITHLVLEVCNPHTATTAVTCPLTSCHLPCIERLSCPKGCVRPILALTPPNQDSPLFNLQVIQRTPQDSTFPLEGLFNFHHIPTSSQLYYLHVDFDHTFPRLLEAISRAAPRLNTLRLVESAFSDRDWNPLWDDAYNWECSLLSFMHLGRLLVQTPRSITPKETPSGESEDEELEPGLKLVRHRQKEDDVIRRWLVFPHPYLTEVRIWTKAFAGYTNGERMSVWEAVYDERRGYNQWRVVHDCAVNCKEVCSDSF